MTSTVLPAQSYSLAWCGAPSEVNDCEFTCPTMCLYPAVLGCTGAGEEKAEWKEGPPRSGALPDWFVKWEAQGIGKQSDRGTVRGKREDC